mmetsp:Transcript_71/g.201  ORF Transcript_71/g.201 Transcript_71/m.201 type:complete len:157 (-) Transcript_71:12-482(-)
MRVHAGDSAASSVAPQILPTTDVSMRDMTGGAIQSARVGATKRRRVPGRRDVGDGAPSPFSPPGTIICKATEVLSLTPKPSGLLAAAIGAVRRCPGLGWDAARPRGDTNSDTDIDGIKIITSAAAAAATEGVKAIVWVLIRVVCWIGYFISIKAQC